MAVSRISCACPAVAPLEGRAPSRFGTDATRCYGRLPSPDCRVRRIATVRSGGHAGEQIGNFIGKVGNYEGKITDPDAKKTYDGSLTVSGNALKMKGCVLKVVCESQTWPRL